MYQMSKNKMNGAKNQKCTYYWSYMKRKPELWMKRIWRIEDDGGGSKPSGRNGTLPLDEADNKHPRGRDGRKMIMDGRMKNKGQMEEENGKGRGNGQGWSVM